MKEIKFARLFPVAPVITDDLIEYTSNKGVKLSYATDFKSLVAVFLNLIAIIIPVIFSLSILVILWGIFQYIFLSGGDERKVEESKNFMIYGVLGLFVMVSVWGIVKVLQTTFFL